MSRSGAAARGARGAQTCGSPSAGPQEAVPTEGFAEQLVAWQRHSGRHDLPWQKVRDPYRIWLSEVMLQQTQVTTVLGYYERFLAAFPDVLQLAAAPLERVMELWSGLGYYSRARHLHACAQRIARVHGGVFPSDPAKLVELPGIGRSTAAAIAVFSAGVRAPILDGNVKRVLCRVFGIAGYPGERAVHERLWELAESLVPERDIEAYTQGLMDLGATVCTTRKPRCENCFARPRCVAYREDRIAVLPERKPRRAYPVRAVVMLVLHHAGAVLLQKRAAPGIWGGLWCLPEWPRASAMAAIESFAAERGSIAAVATLAPFVHGFTHFQLDVEVCAIDLGVRAAFHRPDDLWLDLEDARGAALPAPVKRVLEALWQASPLHGAAARPGPGRTV